jgi:CheY-like chemotaxis protein
MDLTTFPESLHVLLVDDCKDDVGMLAILFRAAGHKVLISYDGRSAVETANRHHPDVIISDIGLPQINGYEVARQVRASAGDDYPLMIAVTGYGSDDDRREALHAGFDFHLVKPYNIEQLFQLLPVCGQPRKQLKPNYPLSLVG